MATPILNIPELAAGQATPYATANAMGRTLEAAANDFLSVDLSAGNVTLTSEQYRGYVLFRSSGNTVARDLTLPAIKRLVVIENTGSEILSVIKGATTIELAAGRLSVFYTDGTADGIVEITPAAAAGQPVEEVSGTSYDVLAADENKYLNFTNAGGKTITFRPNATEALPDSGEWHFRNSGAGNATITEGSGVTITAQAGGTLVLAQNMTATVKRIGVDSFHLIGQTVPA